MSESGKTPSSQQKISPLASSSLGQSETPTVTRTEITVPATQPSIAAPSVSAEQQWIRTVVNPSIAPSSTVEQLPSPFDSPEVTTAAPSYVVSSNQTGPPPGQHVIFSTHIDTDGGDRASVLLQTPGQVAAQRRMELMQKEVDEVIGVMRMNFDDKCVLAPDRRLSELYHHCPDYNSKWKCGGGGEEEEERRRKRKRFWKQMCILFALLLLICLLLLGDYFLWHWLIRDESQKELLEAAMWKQNKTNTTETAVTGTLVIDNVIEVMNPDREESTTVMIITEIEEEDVKATLGLSDSDDDAKGSTEMLDVQILREHDVLDPAEVADDEDDEADNAPGLVATNME